MDDDDDQALIIMALVDCFAQGHGDTQCLAESKAEEDGWEERGKE